MKFRFVSDGIMHLISSTHRPTYASPNHRFPGRRYVGYLWSLFGEEGHSKPASEDHIIWDEDVITPCGVTALLNVGFYLKGLLTDRETGECITDK